MRQNITLIFALLVAAPIVSQARQTVAVPGRSVAPRAGASYDDAVAKARSLAAQKNFKDAVASAEQAIQMDDKRWEAYVVAAEAYSGQQLYDDAIGMLQAALIRAPQEKKQLIRDAITETRKLLSTPATATAAPPQAPAAAPPAPAQAAPPGAAAPAGAPSQAEIVLWKSIENSKNPDDYKAYLKAYPGGAFAPLAEQRIASLAENSPEKVIKTQTDWLRDNANASISQEDRRGRVVRNDVQAVDSVNGCRVSLSRGYERFSIDFSQIEASAIEVRKGFSSEGFFLWLPVRKSGRAMALEGTLIPVRFPAQSVAPSSNALFNIYFADQAIANEAVDRMVQLARACQSASK